MTGSTVNVKRRMLAEQIHVGLPEAGDRADILPVSIEAPCIHGLSLIQHFRDDVLAEKYTTKYESVIAFGRVSLVSDSAEIRAAIEKFALKYCPKESEENRKKAIEDEWNALEMISFDIEHLTGKIGLEVLAERNENR